MRSDSTSEESKEDDFDFVSEGIQDEAGSTDLDDIQIEDEGLLDEDESQEDDVEFVPETVESDSEDVEQLDYEETEESAEDLTESSEEPGLDDDMPDFENESVEVEEEVPSVETVIDEDVPEVESSELDDALAAETTVVDEIDEISQAEGFASNDEIETAEETVSVADTVAETEETEEESKLSADLFIKLRALSEYLPVDKKQEFQDSRESLLLDYIIRKLSGEPGLLQTAQNVRDSLNLQDEPLDNVSLSQTADVLNDMKSYLASLPDRKLAHSLQDQMDGAIKILKDE